ncbi:MAG: DUF6702 family protein [Rhodospirillaceae bacterium]|nr:DUF6702 family protein [Rhodospirillaceae bacterium]
MNHSRRGMVGVAAAALIASVARAHGFHAAFTVIEQNPRTAALEIIHRIFAADLDLMLAARTGRTNLVAETPEAEKLIDDYIRDTFSLKTAEGRALRLDWVGLKVEVETVFAYQEVPAPGALTGLTVANQMLVETHPGQINTVNVSVGGRTKTLVFMSGDGPQSVAF